MVRGHPPYARGPYGRPFAPFVPFPFHFTSFSPTSRPIPRSGEMRKFAPPPPSGPLITASG